MKTWSLTTRVLVVSSLVLFMFGGASLGLMHRSQTQLSLRAMDSLLADDAFSLSALVNAIPGGKFDFEITPLALSNYQNSQNGEFFRFFDADSGRLLRESLTAPDIQCSPDNTGKSMSDTISGTRTYRLRSVLFQPETDEAYKNSPPFQRGRICLVVGVDQAQYLDFVHQTFFSTIPLLVALAFIFMAILFFLVRILMKDLSHLSDSLQTVDFGATHAFPQLPKARTQEVKAVVEKLHTLHEQAASVYSEMWLFLGRAAHQLKTPVAAIQATLQVTLRKERTQEELLESMNDLNLASERLTILIKKLITSSRISYQALPRPEAIDLSELVNSQLKMLLSRAQQRGIKIQVEPSPALSVMGTSYLLSEILGNLIENAILYSRPDGVVTISWINREQSAIISIRDHGPGFSENVKASLFEPFLRGDERHVPGSGLGLSIAYKSAQLLNGSITLQESTSSGSLLNVTLPLTLS